MSAPSLFDTLQIPLASTGFLEGWAESAASLPAGQWECVTPAYVESWCDKLHMSAQPKAALLAGLRLFVERPELLPLAWHGFRLLCRAGNSGIHSPYGFPVYGFPVLSTAIHPAAPLLPVYCCLAAAPHLRKIHAVRGVPESITLDTLNDIEVWMKTTFAREGYWGCNKINWLVNHFSAKLYRLGRLQFEICNNSGLYRAYRNNHTDETVVLVAEETLFRQDGQADGCNEIKDPHSWRSVFQEENDRIRATPVHPHGYALPEPITLDLAEWSCVLQPGDTCLGVHIQAEGGMEHEPCAASFAAALPFFKQCFPELEIKAFNCTSWLLDNQFNAILKPSSNIVRFLREWYLVPNRFGSDAQALDRVFGGPIEDLNAAPRQTSLQRAILEHMQAGKRCLDSSAFFFVHDLPWGREVYRKDGQVS